VTVQAFLAIAMIDISRANVRQLSTEFYDRGDYTGWFEALSAQAG
jgi:hypothetical protein